ncbi:transferase [Pseudonocardia asaccharolytica DSM 44247 = NBRC 16224]|uniref:Transferase n=1 Tax=Pseudonocardia asaccharolytica DSM 44247 = NBRC 16224 TaxID=1123024 RepID=A0A511D7M6_9PSEU|nr:transferase [Pseudonocardia asaccharolytica DSM 44247 = NBRC 16224]
MVADLGTQPGCEYFPPLGDPGPDPVFPLRLWLCADCGLAQLADDTAVPEDPQGTQPEALTQQADDALGRLLTSRILPAAGTVAEFPSPHGGSWLPRLAALGLRQAPPDAPADVVLDCCFGLMHAEDQETAFRDRAARTRPGGLLLVQFHSLASILRRTEWNAIRHGHYAYYSVPAMRTMLAGVGLTAFAAFWFPLYGGTVLIAARRDADPDTDLATLTEREIGCGVLDPVAMGAFSAAVRSDGSRLAGWLADERRRGRRVYGYGAASRSVGLLHSSGVGRDLLPGVADVSAAKQHSRMPGTDIPVIGTQDLVTAEPESVLLFVPDLLDEVRAALPGIEANGGRWVVADEVLDGKGQVS